MDSFFATHPDYGSLTELQDFIAVHNLQTDGVASPGHVAPHPTPPKIADALPTYEKVLSAAGRARVAARRIFIAQARMLEWQARTIFAGGCAGLFVFAWTDEWFRGGNEIDDWKFGLTTRDRTPKPAQRTHQGRFAGAVRPEHRHHLACCDRDRDVA